MAHLTGRAALAALGILAAAAALVTVAVPAASAGGTSTPGIVTRAPLAHTVSWNPGALLVVHTYEVDFTVTSTAARDLVVAAVVSTDAAGHVLGTTKSSVQTVSTRLRDSLVVVTIPDGAASSTVTFTAVYGTPVITNQSVTELALMS